MALRNLPAWSCEKYITLNNTELDHFKAFLFVDHYWKKRKENPISANISFKKLICNTFWKGEQCVTCDRISVLKMTILRLSVNKTPWRQSLFQENVVSCTDCSMYRHVTAGRPSCGFFFVFGFDLLHSKGCYETFKFKLKRSS